MAGDGKEKVPVRSLASALGPIRGPLAVVAAISFVSSLGIGVMLPLMPLYALSLGASPMELGLMTSVFALANTAGQLVAGLRMDQVGSLPFVRAGTALYAVSNALIATAQDALALIAYRGMAGLGAGANLVATRVYIAETAPPERMGVVNGALSSAAAAGSVIGPAFGGAVVALMDLRGPFVLVAVTSAVGLLGLLALPRPARAAPAARPAAPRSSFDRSVVVLLVSNTLLGAGFGGFITTYAPFATQVRSWTLLEVGFLFTAAGAGSVVFGVVLGQLADRIGRRRVAVLAPIPASLMGFAMVLGLDRTLVFATMFLAGGAMAGFMACWYALLNEASPDGRKGRIFGFVSAISNGGTIAGALGAALAWQLLGLEAGLVLASACLLIAGPVLLALPTGKRYSASVEAASAAAG